MWNSAIRAIIDLLKIRKDVQKTDLEIGKLKRDQAEASRIIRVATFDEVKKYDPLLRNRLETARRIENEEHRGIRPPECLEMNSGRSIFSRLVWTALVLLLVFWLYKHYHG